jgi:hypothetical protein
MTNKIELDVLVRAGNKAEKASTEPHTVEEKPTAEPATEIDFSHLGGKLVHRLEPASMSEGEPSIEEKFRDAGVYGATGGSVLANSSGQRGVDASLKG